MDANYIKANATLEELIELYEKKGVTVLCEDGEIKEVLDGSGKIL